MKLATEKLVLAKTLADTIELGDELTPTNKFSRREGINKKLTFTECTEDGFYRPVLRVEGAQSKPGSPANWDSVNFYQPSRNYRVVPPKLATSPKNLLALNKTLVNGAPTMLFSVNGIDYLIGKGTKANLDTKSLKITLDQEPCKVGLYKNTALFLDSEQLSLVECSNFVMYQIALPDAIDMAIPEGNAHSFPVLRQMTRGTTNLREIESAFLEVVDMHAGKITTHLIRGNEKTRRVYKLAATWHPQQFICGSNHTLSLVDLREKQSHVFWYHGRSFSERTKNTAIVDLERVQDPKLAMVDREYLTMLDMRWLTNQYSRRKLPFNKPFLATNRKDVAVFNRGGEFFFQSASNQDLYTYRAYEFPFRHHFVAFDWTGHTFERYNTAAFLFTTKLQMFHASGGVEDHLVNHSCVPKPAINQKDSVHDVSKRSKKRFKALFASAKLAGRMLLRLPKPMVQPASQYTYLRRLLHDGFRDPLDPPQPCSATPPAILAKALAKQPLPYFRGVETGQSPDTTADTATTTAETAAEPESSVPKLFR